MVSVIEGAIAQSLPEHPKKEFIFSLSTAFGDAYLFQVRISIQGLEASGRMGDKACPILSGFY